MDDIKNVPAFKQPTGKVVLIKEAMDYSRDGIDSLIVEIGRLTEVNSILHEGLVEISTVSPNTWDCSAMAKQTLIDSIRRVYDRYN